MRNPSPWLAVLFVFSIRALASDGEGLDSGVRDVFVKGRKAKEFHCKIPKSYGHKSNGKKGPQALSRQTDEDLGEVPPPPPPDPTLCLTDPAKFYEDQAKSFYEQSVLNNQAFPPLTDAVIQVDGAPDVKLAGAPEELRIFKRLLTSGAKEGKKPLLSGPASWPNSADICPAHDAVCSLTRLYDFAGTCAGDGPCDARESAYLALNMAKTTRYFPTLTQWYPALGTNGEDWTQRWDVKTLRSMTHVFSMLPSRAERLAVDKDFRKFPPRTVIGQQNQPVLDGGGSATIGMAQILFFDGGDTRPAGYSDAYILVTDKLVNTDRMVTCKGLVHELTHHLDYSFMFDASDLMRTNRASSQGQAGQATLDHLSREWGVKAFGKYSGLQVADALTGEPSSFEGISWSCQRPGGGCSVRTDESAGFVTDYARQVGPMDDFAESVAHYICDPVELLLRSPVKYKWLKTHLFADRAVPSAASREFWVPDHEKWAGFDDSLKAVSAGSAGSDALLASCLGSFSQFQAQSFKWTSGPQAGQSFSKIAAFFSDPDPSRRRGGMLKGFFAQDVLSQFNCVGELANRIDSEIRSGMTSGRRADPMYCGIGSQDAVQYLTAKRAGYVASPFLQALANLGLKDEDGTTFQALASCRAENRDSCAFLKAFNRELDGFKDALDAAGLTEAGRVKGVALVLSLLRNGR